MAGEKASEKAIIWASKRTTFLKPFGFSFWAWPFHFLMAEAKNGFLEAVFGVKIWFFCHFFRWTGASSEQDTFFARLLGSTKETCVYPVDSAQTATWKLESATTSADVASTWRGNAQGCLAQYDLMCWL